MKPHDKLKLEIMGALKAKPLSVFELMTQISDPNLTAHRLAMTLEELKREGYVVQPVDSSSVQVLYRHASETSLSDLTAKLLPHRDPVREAHAQEATQERNRVFRYKKDGGADLGEDD